MQHIIGLRIVTRLIHDGRDCRVHGQSTRVWQRDARFQEIAESYLVGAGPGEEGFRASEEKRVYAGVGD